MKCVILAGGLGTRISEETHKKPKPLINIGTKTVSKDLKKINKIIEVIKIEIIRNITNSDFTLSAIIYLEYGNPA